MKKAAVFIILATLALAVHALATEPLRGDVAKGKVLAKRCVCHKHDLDGKSAAFLTQRLEAYQKGEADPKAMVLQAKKLTPQEIADVAAFFSSL